MSPEVEKEITDQIEKAQVEDPLYLVAEQFFTKLTANAYASVFILLPEIRNSTWEQLDVFQKEAFMELVDIVNDKSS